MVIDKKNRKMKVIMHIYVQDEVHTVCIGRRKDKGKEKNS